MGMHFVKERESNLSKSKTGYFEIRRGKIKNKLKRKPRIEKKRERILLCIFKLAKN